MYFAQIWEITSLLAASKLIADWECCSTDRIQKLSYWWKQPQTVILPIPALRPRLTCPMLAKRNWAGLRLSDVALGLLKTCSGKECYFEKCLTVQASSVWCHFPHHRILLESISAQQLLPGETEVEGSIEVFKVNKDWPSNQNSWRCLIYNYRDLARSWYRLYALLLNFDQSKLRKWRLKLIHWWSAQSNVQVIDYI